MSARFVIMDTPIPALKVLQRKPIADNRGCLERLFCADELQALIPFPKRIVQINHTLTCRGGTIRGLHFQYPPHAETKFVSCLQGEVFDVAVDLRRGSSTFLHWHAEVLSAENHKTFLIPEGFAHGFQTLTENCGMLYFHTAAYRPDAEGGFHVQDPTIDIRWPIPAAELSLRDSAHALVDNAFAGVPV